MAELKTQPTKASVTEFIDAVPDEKRRKDCRTIIKLMKDATGAKPVMWGSSIIGFGRFSYKAGGGRENEWMLIGFSPRKSDLTLYIMPGVEAFPEFLRRLGKFKTGRSCLYIKKLEDVDLSVLRDLINQSVQKFADKE